MRRVRNATLAFLILAIFLPLTTSAHNSSPLHTDTITVGAYQMNVAYFNWPVRAEQDAIILITPADPQYQHRELGVAITLNPPASGGGRTVVEGVTPDPDTTYGYAVTIRPAYVGNWSLLINVRGPQGGAGAVTNVPVAGPPAIPEWLGWAVGFVPLLGLLGFAVSEGRKVAHAKIALAQD